QTHSSLTHASSLTHFLLIDPDSPTRELMRQLFSPAYELTCVDNGQAGLEAIGNHDFDAVLLDIMMPDMSGFTVLERIRGNPASSHLPVILISGLNDNETIVKGLNLGANDYLTKPVNIHVAHARVNMQVKLKRLLDEHKQAVMQLEQLSQLREHFFKIASHDLKNPLANLRLALHELSYFISPDPEAEAIQSVVHTTLGDMQSLIEDFLDLAALENTGFQLALNYIALKDCIVHVVTQFERLARRKNITLRVAETDGVVLADRAR